MRNVTKEIFLNALVCPALGWLMRSGDITKQISELTLGERFRIEQGIEIGRRARELFPGAPIVSDTDLLSASAKTKSFMNDRKVSAILEGTFLVDGLTTRADILVRKGDSWDVLEVKSSVNDREEFIDDVAYTAMVIGLSGFRMADASLLLISRNFRLGMKNENLFVGINHTKEVLERVEVFKPFWKQIEEVTRSRQRPESKLRFECRKCQIFEECLGQNIKNHIFDIPRLSQSKFDKLAESGITRIEDIPEGFLLTENQAVVRQCVQTNSAFVNGRLKDELASIQWPAFYLDFETVMTAIPLYPDIAPFTQIPTQYSAHKCSEPGNIISHFEYLADPRKDCRRGLAEKLIEDLEGQGSIVAYGSFEKTIINNLAKEYPGLSGKLNSLVARLVDFEAIMKKNFYHPGFQGSTSIKRTLPVLVPDMSYAGLKIADGDSAMAAFAYLALGKYHGREADEIKGSLLEYCERDTLSMIKLHKRLAEYASA